jgi:outer membrane protein assembly factor BamB
VRVLANIEVMALEADKSERARKPFLFQTDWRQSRFRPDHTGLNPYENVLSPETVSGLDLQWTYVTGLDVQGSPAFANGVVYIGSDDGNLCALSSRTGAKLWSFPVGGYVWSAPAVFDGVVYVGSLSGPLYALDAETGAQLWSYAAGDIFGPSPEVVDGIAYIGMGNSSDDEAIYALNARTGS